MMKDFLAKGGKIQKVPAGKKTDPNKLKKPVKEDTEHFGISGIETQRPEHLDEDGIPPITKDNKPGVKIAKIRATRDKKEDGSKGDTESLKQQIGVLRQKLEIEKQKAVKPQPNKDTGEVPLTIGVAYKHLKDKAAKEDKKDEKDPDIKKEAVEPKKENKKIQAKNKADNKRK